MTLIIVPGTPGNSIELEHRTIFDFHGILPDQIETGLIKVSTWSHGWPFEYLRRPFVESRFLIDNDGLPVAWSSLSAWPLTGRVYAFSFFKLLANIFIGLAIVILTVAACQRWRSRRKGYRFSLADAGAFLTLVCLILGWVQFHSTTRSKEQAIVDGMYARGSFGSKKFGPSLARAQSSYQGPTWLRRLVGNPYLLPFCFHVESLDLDLRLLSSEDYQALLGFAYVHNVRCDGSLNNETVEFLAALPRLQALNEGVSLGFGGYPGFNASHIPKPLVTLKNTSLLLRLPNLTTLNLRQITPADLKILANMPHLENLEFRSSHLLIDDLSVLDAFPALKTVDLSIAATHEELEEFQNTRPNLQVRWDRSRSIDVWKLVQLRIARWKGQTQLAELQSSRYCLDLSDILLTNERLNQLPETLPEITEIIFGNVDTAVTAIKLISRCEAISGLDLRYVPLTKLDLVNLNLPQGWDWYIQQGPLTFQNCQELIKELNPNFLFIFGSTFSADQAAKIENVARPSCCVLVYRGFEEGDSELINQPAESAPGGPFSF